MQSIICPLLPALLRLPVDGCLTAHQPRYEARQDTAGMT